MYHSQPYRRKDHIYGYSIYGIYTNTIFLLISMEATVNRT